ncbi:MAG: YcxB family protein [Bacteroidota bacterium]
MTITTKKFGLPKKKYVRLAFSNVLRQQWWVPLLLISIGVGLFLYTKSLWAITPSILLIGYLIFWLIQFYAVTQLAESKMLFERAMYQINSQQIVMMLSPKHGMPISWKQITHVKKGKDYFTLFISKGHLIHFPHKIFAEPYQITAMHNLLKGKKLLK